MNFPGSKGGAGIAQWIISQMPAHRVYIELFLGKGLILRTKQPALFNIGIELDPAIIAQFWQDYKTSGQDCQGMILEGNALEVRDLPRIYFGPDTLVYADPPYLGSVRNQVDRDYYGREFKTEDEHRALLSVLTSLQCMVMISGYRSELYQQLLPSWRTSTKWTLSRGGTRVQECLWMNFPKPIFYHDTRFIGEDFTARQRIKRKVNRWRKKFASMAAAEKWAVYEALTEAL